MQCQLTEGERERKRGVQRNFFDFYCKSAHMERAWSISLGWEKHFEFYKAVRCQNVIFTSHSFMGQMVATECGIIKYCLLLHVDKIYMMPQQLKMHIFSSQQRNANFLSMHDDVIYVKACDPYWPALKPRPWMTRVPGLTHFLTAIRRSEL